MRNQYAAALRRRRRAGRDRASARSRNTETRRPARRRARSRRCTPPAGESQQRRAEREHDPGPDDVSQRASGAAVTDADGDRDAFAVFGLRAAATLELRAVGLSPATVGRPRERAEVQGGHRPDRLHHHHLLPVTTRVDVKGDGSGRHGGDGERDPCDDGQPERCHHDVIPFAAQPEPLLSSGRTAGATAVRSVTDVRVRGVDG